MGLGPLEKLTVSTDSHTIIDIQPPLPDVRNTRRRADCSRKMRSD